MLTDRRSSFSVHQLYYRLHAAEELTEVARQFAYRIDFPEWLGSMNNRDHKIAADLAAGHSNQEVSKRFGICNARISQKRKEFAERWERFHEGAAA